MGKNYMNTAFGQLAALLENLKLEPIHRVDEMTAQADYQAVGADETRQAISLLNTQPHERSNIPKINH